MLKAKRAAVALRRQTGKLHLSTAALALAVAAGFAVPAMAQQTTSSITGLILRPDGEPAVGTRVEIVHVPTGTRATTTVNTAGRFNAPGLRIGGPYRVRLMGEGLQPEAVENIFLSIGEPFALDLVLNGGSQIEELVVTGERLEGFRYGNTSVYDRSNIERQPVIERRLQEIVRQDPAVFVDLTPNDLEDQGISILGFNTRFNSVVVDGVDQIDDFGIGFTGLPTQGSPISLDAIEAIAVQKSPFQVENGQFQGGQINIVTKTGSNEFSGSAFASYTGAVLRGTRSRDNTFTDEGFEEIIYGATLGGPIIKDKLFFFFSFERTQEGDGVNECPAGATTCSFQEVEVPLSIYEQVRQISQDVYGYDPGSYDAVPTLTERRTNYLGKIDWNVTEDHRASLTFQRTTSSNPGQPGPDINAAIGIRAPNSYNTREDSVPQLFSFQLFSDWTDRFTTEIRFGYKNQMTSRRPFGDPGFAEVILTGLPDGGGTIQIGTDDGDQFFETETDRFQYKFKAEYTIGAHSITAGYERDTTDIFSNQLFNNDGSFVFTDPAGPQTTLDAFRTRMANSYSVQGSFTGDPFDVAQDWTLTSNQFYVQDEWEVTPDLTFLYGFRYDRFGTDDAPLLSQAFVSRYGFPNNLTLNGEDVWSPRFAASYDLDDRTTFRAGAGIFAGGTPVTWFSNAFNENGISVLTAQFNRPATGTPNAATASVLNNADPTTIPQAALDFLAQGTDANVTAVDPDFEVPSQWRFNVGIDREFDLGLLGDGWQTNVDVTYSMSRNALLWQDIRVQQEGTLPDGRPRYVLNTTPLDNRSTNTTADAAPRDIIVTNTPDGRSIVVQASIENDWQTRFGDFDAKLSYAWIDAQDVSPANDIDNTRDVFRTGAYNDINNPPRAPGIQAIRHNGIWQAGWSKSFFGRVKTGLSFFGQHRTSSPFSFVFLDPGGAVPAGLERINPGTDMTARDRILFYVPTGPNDPLVRYLPTTNTAGGNRGDSYEDLLPIIEQFGLQDRAGRSALRNRQRAPVANIVDMKFTQEIPSPIEGHKAIIEFDIRNVLNLVNNNWGQITQYDIREPLADVFVDRVNNQYVYRNINTSLEDDLNVRQRSVWSARVGVRYQF